MKVYKFANLEKDKIIIDDNSYDAIFGKHEIYVPELEEKFIFSVRGRIVALGECKFKKEMIANGILFSGKSWGEKYLDSIVNEYSLLKYFARRKFSPNIGDMIFIQETITHMNDYVILDQVGMFGYKMKNAYNLPEGKFSVDIVNDLVEKGIIQAHPGALNDLTNVDRKNLINGYCIDVRRSFREDLPFYNNFKYNGKKETIWNDIKGVING